MSPCFPGSLQSLLDNIVLIRNQNTTHTGQRLASPQNLNPRAPNIREVRPGLWKTGRQRPVQLGLLLNG